MILILDNYDSFVANVARYLRELGRETRLVRNDAVSVDEIRRMAPEAIVVSPGPCGPREAGVSNAAIAALSGRVPILGVCLGHQCIGDVFGARVTRAGRPMHGRASRIAHDGTGLFADLPERVAVGRYHSLIVELDDGDLSVPLMVTARSDEGEVMALAHRSDPTYGVQFHPESILTEHGHALFGNFLALADQFWGGLRKTAT